MRDRILVDRWVEIVSDLLERAPDPLPRDLVGTELMTSFDGGAASFVRRSGTHWHVQIWPSTFAPDFDGSHWEHGDILYEHPLLRWYATTSGHPAHATDLVPASVADPRSFRRWRDRAREYGGLPHQLALPLELGHQTMAAFIVTRADRPYGIGDVAIARRLQRLLIAVGHHVDALQGLAGTDVAAELALTRRETAVLSLLAQGCTAVAIGRRLGCSPRTVHKHLERIYTKLHVRDRLAAVLRAQAAGILPTPPTEPGHPAGANGSAS